MGALVCSTRSGQPAQRRLRGLAASLAAIFAVAVGLRAQTPDWTIPAEAPSLTNPLAAAPDVLKRGGEVFASHCRKCHGPEGRGNGPSSDPEHPAADLTVKEISATADGVLFYKVWNGRRPMPAFKTALEKDEVWAVIAYVKSLGPE